MRIHSFKTRFGTPSSAYVISPFYSGKNTEACIEDCLNAGINRLVIPFSDSKEGLDGVKESELVRVLQLRLDVLEQRHRRNAMCGNTGALASDHDRCMRVLGVMRNSPHSLLTHLDEYEELVYAKDNDSHQ